MKLVNKKRQNPFDRRKSKQRSLNDSWFYFVFGVAAASNNQRQY